MTRQTVTTPWSACCCLAAAVSAVVFGAGRVLPDTSSDSPERWLLAEEAEEGRSTVVGASLFFEENVVMASVSATMGESHGSVSPSGESVPVPLSGTAARCSLAWPNGCQDEAGEGDEREEVAEVALASLAVLKAGPAACTSPLLSSFSFCSSFSCCAHRWAAGAIGDTRRGAGASPRTAVTRCGPTRPARSGEGDATPMRTGAGLWRPQSGLAVRDAAVPTDGV